MYIQDQASDTVNDCIFPLRVYLNSWNPGVNGIIKLWPWGFFIWFETFTVWCYNPLASRGSDTLTLLLMNFPRWLIFLTKEVGVPIPSSIHRILDFCPSDMVLGLRSWKFYTKHRIFVFCTTSRSCLDLIVIYTATLIILLCNLRHIHTHLWSSKHILCFTNFHVGLLREGTDIN